MRAVSVELSDHPHHIAAEIPHQADETVARANHEGPREHGRDRVQVGETVLGGVEELRASSLVEVPSWR